MRGAVGLAAIIALANPAHAQTSKTADAATVPKAEVRPLAIDFSDDPVLGLARAMEDSERLRNIVASAIEQNPLDAEASALERAADARIGVARSGYLPSIDVGVTGFRTLERNFSDDPFNLIERSRPRERVDFTFSVAQPLIDFGVTDGRVEAALERYRAAGFEREARAGEVAGDVIAAWTQVFAYQSIERLVAGYMQGLDGLEAAVAARIEQGVAPEGDQVRVASLRAQASVQLAQIRRLRASAEARFEQMTGFVPPARILRPPLLDPARITRDYAVLAADQIPQVRSAEARAQASEQTAKSTEGEKFPTLSARLDHGRYGIYEAGRDDFDTRATLNLNWRILGGGVWSQARAARADADAADAVADRIREEARRDAATAWADVNALESQVQALEAAYKAARQSRDIGIARFGAARATVFDVAEAQNVYLDAGSAYIRTLAELDQARYVLLLRTGRLLDALRIDAEVAAP